MAQESEMNPSRRRVLTGASAALLASALPSIVHSGTFSEQPKMATFTTRDDVTLYFKDWGPRKGPVVVLCHGWPLNADSWDIQAIHLANNGFRVIAHDRRGHGRSSQPSDGNDMDHYADDLAQLIAHLQLRKFSLVGFSAGGGEVARFVGRQGTRSIDKLVLISAVTPFLVKTADNPNGAPISVFDQMRAESLFDRSQYYRNLADGPFYGFNRSGAKPSKGQSDLFWLQGMSCGHKNTYECIAAYSEDFRGDVRKFDKPTLVVHGSDDQIVPIDLSARVVAKMLPDAQLKIYDGAPHGLTFTHRDQLNADLLGFLKS
jgi:non-heme chloroperoxidase